MSGEPENGQQVGQTSSLTFSGYIPSGSAPVNVEAFNHITGEWDVLGSTTSAASPTFTDYGSDWFLYQRSNVIPATTSSARYWEPGASGFFARVRTRSGVHGFYPVHEDYPACQSWGADPASTTEWIERCSAGRTEAVVCTSSYIPANSARRSPCPRRGLRVDIGGDRHFFTHHDRENLTRVPPATDIITTLGYRADATSFIDFFDGQLTSGTMTDRNIVRVRYPRSRSSTTLEPLDVNTLASSLGVPVTPWLGPRSFRMYDSGECSQLQSWRSMIGRVTSGTRAALQQLAILGISTTNITSPQMRLRPIISASGNQDGFQYSGQMLITNSTLTQVHGLITLSFTIRLSSSGGVVTAALDSGSTIQITEPSGSSGQFQNVFAGRTPAAASVALQPLLAPAIADQINLSRPRVRTVPATVERAHARADGYELVLAETGAELEVVTNGTGPGLRDLGFCGRPDPSPLGNQSGRFTEVRSPAGSEPVAFGD